MKIFLNNLKEFSIGFIYGLLLITLCAAATSADTPYKDIEVELEKTCVDYKRACDVIISRDINAQASTTENGKIIIGRRALDTLSNRELLAVGYHEVGHWVLKHHIRLNEYVYNNYPATSRGVMMVRHQHEYEADLFATYLQAMKGDSKNHLPVALKKITPVGAMNTAHFTHPSTNNRIRLMEEQQAVIKNMIKQNRERRNDN